MGSRYGIVEYFGLDNGHRCGYCKGTTTNLSHGMWSHVLMCEDYENLINRGWRRSGKYMYKPLMNKTCCPQYAIRCQVGELRLTKSQKKVLKRMNNFLISGTGRQDSKDSNDNSQTGEKEMNSPKASTSNSAHLEIKENLQRESTLGASTSSNIQSGKSEGIRPSKGSCKKAKDIRREKKLQKLQATAALEGSSVQTLQQQSKKRLKNEEKSLEDYIEKSRSGLEAKHTLEVKTVRSHPRSEAFERSFHEECKLFETYQMSVHKETKESSTEDQVSVKFETKKSY